MATRKSPVGTKGKVTAAKSGLKVTEEPSLKAAGRLTVLAKAWFVFDAPDILIFVQVLNEDSVPVADLGRENFRAWIGAALQELNIENVVAMQEPRGLYVVTVPVDHLPSKKGQYVYGIKAQKGAEQGWTLVDVLKL